MNMPVTLTRKNDASILPAKRLPFPVSQLALLDRFKQQGHLGEVRKQVLGSYSSSITVAFGKLLDSPPALSGVLYARSLQFLEVPVDKYEIQDFITCCLSPMDKDLKLGRWDTYFNFMLGAGAFTSALISRCTQNTISLDFGATDMELMSLMRLKGKRISIPGGKFGWWMGMEMESGTLRIRGYSGEYTGCLMKGGRIIVDGGTGPHLGLNMEGGAIIVNGNIGSIGTVKGGNIFQYKTQLVKDGKRTRAEIQWFDPARPFEQ